MQGKPFIQALRLKAGGLSVVQKNVACVILPCHNYHEATVVLTALEDFIRQLKAHLDADGQLLPENVIELDGK